MEYDPYPEPSHSSDSKSKLNPYVTVRQALKLLEEPNDSTDPLQQAYSKAKWYGKHCQGNIEVKLDH